MSALADSAFDTFLATAWRPDFDGSADDDAADEPRDNTHYGVIRATWNTEVSRGAPVSDANFDTAIWTAGSTATKDDHFVPLLTADPDVVTFATWGQIWAADWGWIDQNLAEAWVVIFPQLVTADGTYLGTPINHLMAMFEEAL